jgi:acyl dehydratase
VQFGRFYEDFEVGAVYRHWPGRTITEHDNTCYALLSMNQNPLYIDAEYARAQPLGRRPVLDTLVFSLAVGLSVADTSGQAIANLGYERVVFERALFPGDSLYAESEVLAKRESASKPGRGIVSIETCGYTQNHERVILLRRRFLVPQRSAATAPSPPPDRRHARPEGV